MRQDSKKHVIIGWVAVSLSALITALWAFWGIIENFHEGWYRESLFENLGLMFVQYLSPMLIFLLIALISIRWRKVGAALHLLAAIFAIGFFNAFSNAGTFLIILPLVGIGLMYWFGSISNKRLAYLMAIGIPLITLIASGIKPAVRVSQRINDGNLQVQLVLGNNVELVWSPAGPGWPEAGTDWENAKEICQTLNLDGLSLSDSPQNIWRLPTVDEVVRSMTSRGQNSGGIWDDAEEEAFYDLKPDKESPLWNVHSQVIYWWTVTEADDDSAFMIAHDGQVWSRSMGMSLPYLGFRCVKSP